MIIKSCLTRVLYFEVSKSGGSCFSYEKDGKQFLITAKHIFKKDGYPTNTNAAFCTRDGIVVKNIDIHYHTNKDIDIAVMDILDGSFLTNAFNNDPLYDSNDLIFGQDCYFLGFAYEFVKKPVMICENPIPLIKKACVAGVYDFGGTNTIILDGINNPGFSGGPVCFYNEKNKKWHFCSVINSYRYHKNMVYRNATIDEIETELFVKSNTGIIYSTNICYALEIINSIS